MAFRVGRLRLSGLLPERQRWRRAVYIHIVAWRLVVANPSQVYEIKPEWVLLGNDPRVRC
jgi:hypothetical protein